MPDTSDLLVIFLAVAASVAIGALYVGALPS